MSGLSREQARTRFDAALDGELSGPEQSAFDAALSEDPILREEFERQRALIEATRALGRERSEVDLLPAVQHKLRVRSRGRFFRDRFAERRTRSAGVAWMLALSAGLVLVVLLWLAYDAGVLASDPIALPP